MQALFTCWIAIIFAIPVLAQDRDFRPPRDVVDRFQLDYPDALEVRWQIHSESYRVLFKDRNLNKNAIYTDKGEWLYTDMEVPLDLVPAKIMDHYRANYGRYPLVRADFHDEVGNNFFKLEINRQGYGRWLKYDADGNFIP